MSLNNKCVFIGNLGKDPEVKTFGENKRMLVFSVASNESYKDLKGEWKTETTWFNCVCFRDGLIDYIQRTSKKGSKVLIQAKYKVKEYADQDAVVKYSHQFVVEEYTPFEKVGKIETPAHSEKKEENDDLPF